MFWKSKKQKEKNIDSGALFKDITQNVAIKMMSLQLIESPQLKFFVDDNGMVEGLVLEHTTDREYKALKQQSSYDYMFVCGMHAFGAGIYVTLFQTKLGKPINEFTQSDLRNIAIAFSQVDAYELALLTLGVSVNSNKKQIFDQIIITAINSATNYAGDNATTPDVIKQLMQVLFNAGITVVMQ
jgi:hypothetical protein